MIGLFSCDLNYIIKYFQEYSWVNSDKKLEKELIKKHRKFIWFSSPGVFVGNSINLITLIFFTHYYGEQFSGLLAAAIQYLGLLIMMFSSSFAQVYYNEIAQIIAKNFEPNSVYELFVQNNAGYENMTQAESIGLIQNDSLRKKLTQYYRQEEELKTGTASRIRVLTREYSDISTNSILNKSTITQVLYAFTALL